MITIFRTEELGEYPNMDQVQTISRSNFVFVLDFTTSQFVVPKDRSGEMESGFLEDFPIALENALVYEVEAQKEADALAEAEALKIISE